MNTGKMYHDSDGNECSIFQAVRREPEWAASRIQVGEEAIADLKKIAEAIHYPECWDTTAYPTLYDAINNVGCNPAHCTKKKEDLD